MENTLDYLLNLAYDFFYLKNNDKCYDIIDINLDDINDVSNIKLVPVINKINSYINHIFNTNVNYIGKTNDKYIFSRIGPINSTITIKLYQNDEMMNDLLSEDNNNKTMNFLLSDFVTKKLTRHIILPIFNIDISVKNLLPFLSKFPETSKLQNAVNKILSISITERFFKTMTLNEYLNKNPTKINDQLIMTIIWQVVHTLFIIRQKYPKFNHNLLNINDITVYITDKDHNYKYFVYDNEFDISNNGITIKIGNFELAEVVTKNNDDIKTFINSLLNNDSINEYLKKYPKIKKIIIEYIFINPEQLMTDKIFIDYFNKNETKNKNIQLSSNNLIESQQIINGIRKLYMVQTNDEQEGGRKKDKKKSRSISSSSTQSTSSPIKNRDKNRGKKKHSKRHSKKHSERHSKKHSERHSKKHSERHSKKHTERHKKHSERHKKHSKIPRVAQALGVDSNEFMNYQNMDNYNSQANHMGGMNGLSGMGGIGGMPGMNGISNMNGLSYGQPLSENVNNNNNNNNTAQVDQINRFNNTIIQEGGLSDAEHNIDHNLLLSETNTNMKLVDMGVNQLSESNVVLNNNQITEQLGGKREKKKSKSKSRRNKSKTKSRRNKSKTKSRRNKSNDFFF